MTPAECLGIEDAKAGIQAILASGAQPVGVGRKEELGEGLPIVPETSALTFDYLKKCGLIMKDNRITVTDIPNTNLKITLKNDFLSRSSQYGARLHQLLMPNKNNHWENILLSYDSYQDVLKDQSFLVPLLDQLLDAYVMAIGKMEY